MTKNYYNDNAKRVAENGRRSIDAGILPYGHFDERSITDVKKRDLTGYNQHHFFAGVGGWPLALQLAGWPSDRPVWTASLPCQPFSVAGKRRGTKDDRHLWPVFSRLVSECRPPTIFGEQVDSKLAREQWIPRVFFELEQLGYACAAADLCAASVGAPHIRQRLFWVAHRAGWLDNANSTRRKGDWAEPISPQQFNAWGDSQDGRCRIVECGDSKVRRLGTGVATLAHGLPRGLGQGVSRLSRVELASAKRYRIDAIKRYGNAIVPQVAAVFIKSFMEI